jgi:predicted GH43/DUF377 family glycosyl hydrolase
VLKVVIEPNEDIGERVVFPITEAQSNGIEDARFVEFEDDGRKTFYATYTAYNGRAIRSELMETDRLPVFPDVTTEGGCHAKQRYGFVRSKDQRAVRDDRSPGQ